MEATYGELAEAGRARVEVYTVALSEISQERQNLLRELKMLLDEQRTAAERAEKEERRAGVGHDDGEEAMETVVIAAWRPRRYAARSCGVLRLPASASTWMPRAAACDGSRAKRLARVAGSEDME